jgi:hypothetical protein
MASAALRERSGYTAALRYQAASSGLLGRIEEGPKAVSQLRTIVPDFTIARARSRCPSRVMVAEAPRRPVVLRRMPSCSRLLPACLCI